jgi:MFS superfamily sulfate permease-like transporter
MLPAIKKDTRILTYGVGGLYILGIFILFTFSRLFSFIGANVDSSDINLSFFQRLTQNFNYLMPVCLIIGAGYILLAYNLPKWRNIAFNINLGLSLFALISLIIFVLSVNLNISSLFQDLNKFPKELSGFMYIMRGFQLLIGLASTVFPHLYLGILYRKMNKKIFWMINQRSLSFHRI